MQRPESPKQVATERSAKLRDEGRGNCSHDDINTIEGVNAQADWKAPRDNK